MKAVNLMIKSILLFAILLSSCKKEAVECSNEKEFCAFVNAEEFDKTSASINKYLKSLNKRLSENEKLEIFRVWLECKSCVTKAEILCNSCVYTDPAQSELRITFLVKGQKIEKILDITMAEPLRFRNFHD